MIAELETDKQLVRFEWYNDYSIVNVKDFDKKFVAYSSNVNKDIAIARKMWKRLIRKGFERVVYIPVDVIHLNLNGESINDS